MEKSIDRFIWRYSFRTQVIIALITAAYFPALYGMLELPKLIINNAISVPSTHQILGFTLEPIPFLVVLCLIYFALYVFNGLIKLLINIKKGIMGERMVRRLRYQLIEQILRFPIQRFRAVSQGELISQVTAEAEPLAGYIGEAMALPLFQGGTMITILMFMFIQNFWLGMASVALIPVQIILIPKLQRQINSLNRERVRHIRQFSEHIGETVSGAQAIRIHGIQRYVLAGFSFRLNHLFNIRYQLYKKKFLMKFLNNFINQLTPVSFYMIGGILVLKGQLTVGALVAALAAYKDMTAPWKELLKHYQIQQDAKIKYEQLIEQFDIDEVDDTDYLAPVGDRNQYPIFPLELKNVVTEEGGQKIHSNLSLRLDAGEHVAVVEPDPVRRTHIAELVLSLRQPAFGSICLGEYPIKDIPGSVRSRRLAYQPSAPPIFNTSMYENILLSIKHQPSGHSKNREFMEAEQSGNSTDLFTGDWQDYPDYQFTDKEELEGWYVHAMQATGADKSAVRNGLSGYLTNTYSDQLIERFIAIRSLVHEALQNHAIDIQVFDEREWCPGLSIAENLAFGKLVVSNITPAEVLLSAQVDEILLENGFDRIIEQIGSQIAQIASHGLSGEHSRDRTMRIFNIKTDAKADEILAITRRLSKKSPSQFNDNDNRYLTQLFLNLVIEDHPDIRLPGSVTSKIMFLRDEIDNVLDSDQRNKLLRFEIDQFHPGLTVLENLVFALIPTDLDYSLQDLIIQVVSQVIAQEDLSRDVMLLALKDAEAGIAGSQLSPTDRQNIPLARVLIKKPEILVVNDGLNAYEETEQLKIKNNIQKLLPDMAILWLTSEMDNHSAFDRVIQLNK